METKKTKKVAIERFRTTWLLMGVVVALAFMFMAFEWSKHELVVDTSLRIREHVIEGGIDDIQRTYEQPTPPPPPEIEAVQEILNIVADDSDLTETGVQSSEDIAKVGVVVKEVPLEVVEVIPDEIEIVEFAEKMPEFKGGQSALMQYLSKNIRYPAISQDNNSQGRVIVQFVVNTDGSIVDVKVVRGVDPHLDKEAARVISAMPAWTPGKQGNKTVRVRYTVPVMFKLN